MLDLVKDNGYAEAYERGLTVQYGLCRPALPRRPYKTLEVAKHYHQLIVRNTNLYPAQTKIRPYHQA
jgi:hypothetical protein